MKLDPLVALILTMSFGAQVNGGITDLIVLMTDVYKPLKSWEQAWVYTPLCFTSAMSVCLVQGSCQILIFFSSFALQYLKYRFCQFPQVPSRWHGLWRAPDVNIRGTWSTWGLLISLT